KEFLTSNSGIPNSQSPWCWKNTFPHEVSHLEALKACMQYIQLEFGDEQFEFTEEGEMISPSIFSYASINWTFHFQQAGRYADKELGNDALQLCDTTSQRFSLWFREFQKEHLFFPLANINDLIIVCYFGLTTAVQILLERKSNVDIDSRDIGHGQTSLFWAAENGHEAVAKLLLQKGADVDAKDVDGGTPLRRAAVYGHKAVAKLLLQKGADVDAKDSEYGPTPLCFAAGHGQEAVAKLLLEKDADVDANNSEYGPTPLCCAAAQGEEAIAKLLLEKGADVDAKDEDGRTPLSRAAAQGHEAVAKLLLQKGADVDAKDKSSRAPLSWAAQHGHEAVAKLLLRKGADAWAMDGVARSPLMWALEKRHEAVVDLLLRRGGLVAEAL
ncbi:hypothetical protein V498_07971, partial [Pseudogymnoascus sp. VKM F-4517 (FW-2822)]